MWNKLESNMNKSMKFGLIIATLVVVAFLAALWATSRTAFWFSRFPFEPRMRPPGSIPGDIEFFYTAKTVVSTINVTLLIFLFFTYAGLYAKTRSEFTIGLMIFSAVLLLHALTSNPVVVWFFGFGAFGLGPFALLPDLFTLGALAVLLYLSIKY
jgi:hypothetical protein